MTQEQIIQEARLEAEKVYPKNTASHYSKSREDNEKKQKIFIKGYIQQAEKRRSEVASFYKWAIVDGNQFTFDNTYQKSHSIEELYDLFIQQQQKQE